jgi:hypothetical protein
MAPVILQVPRDGAAHRSLREAPAVAGGELTLEPMPADADGRIDPPAAGQIVLSVPSPETLAREPESVHAAVGGAGRADEPIVVVIEVAEELRDDELQPLLDAAGRARRPVIVRVLGDP